ncbi:DUF1049 domain-containing protein [Candidatus Magnetaquicoccus inordinatus]|uniref:DUF1049 domain-containing protein n=1 Tax=Candidatus Magnetaquicoccus inordinatus TaxID=2496818 RepID=UPI00102D13A5|nr:DUF1049 domain-containing protein [Candidatus Magnetaquicoccus inordinatus]
MVGWLNLLFILVLALLAVLFAAANQKEVIVSLPGGLLFSDIPLFVLAFIPLFLGYLAGTFSAWSTLQTVRKQNDLLLKQNQKLEAELANLRNQPLDNDLPLS